MSVEISKINIGQAPDDGTGEGIRTAFNKINENLANVKNIVDKIDSTYANVIYTQFTDLAITGNIVSDVHLYGHNIYINGSPVVTSATTFPGGPVPNTTQFNDTTDSSSINSGAVIVSGGVGIAKNTTIGGSAYIGGSASIGDITDSTSDTTGALVVAGGAGLGGSLHLAGGIVSGGVGSFAGSVSAGGAVTIASTSQSTNTSTGALTVTGGTGIGKNLFVGGDVTITGNLLVTGAFNNINTDFQSNTFSVADNIIDLNLPPGGYTGPTITDIGIIFNHYQSDSGRLRSALVWAVDTRSLEFYSVGTEDINGRFSGTYGLGKFGSIMTANGTPSTSTTTGDIVVTGGVGVSGNLYASGNVILGSSATSNVVVSATTVSTSTTTGALVIKGGVGVNGALYINNTGDVSANVGTLYLGNVSTNANLGAFQQYANANIGTLYLGNVSTNANIGTLYLGNVSTNANIGTLYLGNVSTNANIGTLYLGNVSTNANIGTLYLGNVSTNANIGTLYLGNVSTNANLGAFQQYANTKIGTNSNSSIITTAVYTTSGVYWSGNGAIQADVTGTGTQTLTNKRITRRISSTTSISSPLAWNSDNYDGYAATAQAGALTLNADSGSPTDMQAIMFRFKDNGTAQALTWTTGSSKSFRAVGLTLPTTTVINKVTYVFCVYNSDADRWDAIATGQES